MRERARCRGRLRREGDARSGTGKGRTTVIAFVQDPDGYKIELIERKRATA